MTLSLSRSSRVAVAAAAALALAAPVLLTASAGPAGALALRVHTDFNRDGYRDIAVGAPKGKVGTTAGGFVTAMYGSSSGINLTKRHVISQNSAFVPGVAETGDEFGYAVSAGDMNGDGRADLVIGAPGETLNGVSQAGNAIAMMSGSNGVANWTQLWVLSSTLAARGAGDRLGHAIVHGDFDADGRADVVLTRPGANDFFLYTGAELSATSGGGEVSTLSGSGRVHYAHPTKTFGLPSGSATTSRTAAEVEPTITAVATGDVTRDGIDDLAIAWRELDGSLWADVWPGSRTEILGAPIVEPFSGGTSLAIGDVDFDGFGDVVAGRPTGSGSIVVVTKIRAGSATPPVETVITQNSPGVPDSSESGDNFGQSVAVKDINHDGFRDIAVGAFGETLGSATRAGAVTVFMNGSAGIGSKGMRIITQNTTGVPGGAERNDQFGYTVSLNDHNRDGWLDLSVGANGENTWDGVVITLRGGSTGIVTSSGAKMYGGGTDGRFGGALTR